MVDFSIQPKLNQKLSVLICMTFLLEKKVSVLIVENKTNQSQNCEFSYFLDLVQK